MKIFNPESLKKWDKFTIQHEPVSSVNLMWRASKNLFGEIINIIPPDAGIIILCGSGNNGGDGLCLAGMLRDAFYKVDVWYCPVSSPTEENMFYAEKVKATEEITFTVINPETSRPRVPQAVYFIDALMGYSFRGKWKDGWEGFIRYINTLPNVKIAVDLPSGLSDENICDNLCIRVDYTLTIQTPKRCFFYHNNTDAVGHWKVVSIGLHQDYYQHTVSRYHTTDHETISPIVRIRKKTDQKWAYGHAALLVGHGNMPGAALLSVKACTRAGAGLTTAYIPKAIVTAAASFVPEAMYQITGENAWENQVHLPPQVTAIGIGPGLGRDAETASLVVQLLSENRNLPKVIDADALNMLATLGEEKQAYMQHAVITPHEKEFRRLFGETKNQEEMENLASEKARELHSIIVLKGAYTRICCPDGNIYYNTTGNPGMAKGGSGDVLTGILTGLLAQGYSLSDAALTGVYIHGLAGDAAENIHGENSILATDMIEQIGPSFQQIKRHER